MAQVAELYLDVKKTGHYTNDIINLRVGDNTDQILVHVLLNGEPHQNVENATFFAEKPDETIVANDPANVVDPSTISYPIPEQLTAVSGHITKAYFYINGTLSTDNFEILIEESVDVNGDPIDYIPGLAGLQKIWDTTKDNWEAKIKDISTGIDSFDTDEAVKDSINKAIEKAKNDSMATLDQAIKDLNDKKNEAETTGTDLDTEVTKLKAKIVDVDSLITDTQAQILAANDSFTKDQQTKVDTAISTMTSSMESAQTDINGIKDKVANIQTAVDALDIPKINADTATALKNSKDAKDAVANKIDGATLNGADVPVTDGKLKIEVADPDMSEYATNTSVDGKLESYAKSDDVDTKINSIPKGISLWKGSADDYAAIESKDDSTEYNVVDDTGIKNIYVGSSEIYKRGIPEGTVLYQTSRRWDVNTSKFDIQPSISTHDYAALNDSFNVDDLNNGLLLAINDYIPTGNASYPFIDLQASGFLYDTYNYEILNGGSMQFMLCYYLSKVILKSMIGGLFGNSSNNHPVFSKYTTTSDYASVIKSDNANTAWRSDFESNGNSSLLIGYSSNSGFDAMVRIPRIKAVHTTTVVSAASYALINKLIAV